MTIPKLLTFALPIYRDTFTSRFTNKYAITIETMHLTPAYSFLHNAERLLRTLCVSCIIYFLTAQYKSVKALFIPALINYANELQLTNLFLKRHLHVNELHGCDTI